MNTPKKPEAETDPFEAAVTAAPVELPLAADPLDDILSDDEITAIRAAARKKVDEEKKKKRKEEFMRLALDEARREAGTMPEDQAWQQEMEQPVRIFIDLPRLRKVTGGELDPDPIIIDQKMFLPGRAYDVPKGLALYLNDLMDKARRHVNAVDGRSRTYYHAGTGQMIYQGGAASGGGSFGHSFEAMHKRPPS